MGFLGLQGANCTVNESFVRAGSNLGVPIPIELGLGSRVQGLGSFFFPVVWGLGFIRSADLQPLKSRGSTKPNLWDRKGRQALLHPVCSDSTGKDLCLTASAGVLNAKPTHN